MIAAVKRWPAALPALLLLLPSASLAAQDLNGAARELARKTAAFAARGDALTVTYRNVSSLTQSVVAEARRAFEAGLLESNFRSVDSGPTIDLRITISEDQSQYLLVAEVHKGDDRLVWMSGWPRETAGRALAASITLNRKRLWDQDQPILDVAFTGAALLVLGPNRITLYTHDTANSPWTEQQSAPITPSKPWPRDLRGHIRLAAAGFQVFLPGMVCNGNLDSLATMTCRSDDVPWLIESSGRGILLAMFMAGRNYFDGRIVMQNGQRKTIPPFYSAAALEDQGRTLWMLALLDGRTQIVDPAFDPAGIITGWGSDLAGVDAHCGGGSQIMATRPTDSGEPDAVQLFGIVNRTTAPVAVPVTFAGPVTALWSAGPGSVVAIEHDLSTGRYAAYVLTVSCGD
jgi:hypothetical protein